MRGVSNKSPFRGAKVAAGLTIVEVMVAAMVLAIAIGSSIGVLRTGFSLIELARDSTMASQILQSEMENLRLKNWASIEELPLDEEEEFNLTGTDFDEGVTNRFTATRLVTLVDNREELMRKVELVATWKTNNGVEHKRHYVTYFAKEGLNDYYYRSL